MRCRNSVKRQRVDISPVVLLAGKNGGEAGIATSPNTTLCYSRVWPAGLSGQQSGCLLGGVALHPLLLPPPPPTLHPPITAGKMHPPTHLHRICLLLSHFFFHLLPSSLPQFRCTTPQLPLGTRVDLTVTSDGGLTGILYSAFAPQGPPSSLIPLNSSEATLYSARGANGCGD